MSANDEILDFDFAGIDPATPGTFIAMPSGEYQVQCTGTKKYYTGESKGEANLSKPNLEFTLTVINHPVFTGTERRLSHSLGESSRQFLLNTLMCLIPEVDWQQGGIKLKLGDLIQKLQGRTANAVIDWQIVKSKNGNDIVVNSVKGLKKFDSMVPPPVASEGNPPVLSGNSTSPIAKQAAAGVASPTEVQNFLNSIPGPSVPVPVSGESALEFGF